MAALTPQQRNTLETAVKKARKVAELGAYNALHGMAVDALEPFAHMDPAQKKLRESLRNKASLLGDEFNIDHLSYELAYETWHKMLFAKFLEANGLLMHTDGVAVTMEDCEELAPEEGFVDKWDAAANYASKMLPAIFRTDDPLMQVVYATDERIKLEEIIDALENQIFVADDALGWVYQFWQSEAKDAINKSGDKIDGEKLPAVTQLFTEPYMVNFLIDNTLGAWWVSRNPGVQPPVKFEYLRMHKPDNEDTERSRSVEVPAAGKFEGWASTTAEVTSLDPCMGSGHFVASLFPVFAALRMHEEGLTKEQATDKVIAENLHGLELDARCTQIAAFNLALTAWKFCGHYKELPEMNLACSGIAPKGKVEDWVKLVGKVERADDKARLENGMKVLYEHFQLAPELGSLLDPSTIKADAFTASFLELQPVLNKALESESDNDQLQRGVMASGILKGGMLLSQKYNLVITNVPFLGLRKQSDILLEYALKNFPEGRHDLSTIFIQRMNKLIKDKSTLSVVIPTNWFFIGSYRFLRQLILNDNKIIGLVKLGAGAFETIGGEVVNVCLFTLNKAKATDSHLFYGIDVSNEKQIANKILGLKGDLKLINQNLQKQNPDSRIVFDIVTAENYINDFAESLAGIQNGDSPKFQRFHWEMESNTYSDKWVMQQVACLQSNYYAGCDTIILYDLDNGHLRETKEIRRIKLHDSDQRGKQAWGKRGVLISRMSSLPISLYTGVPFDQNAAIILPEDDSMVPALFEYCSSKQFLESVRKIDNKINVTSATLAKVPFDVEYWQKVAAEKYPNGLPKPYSDDPTQWLFHGQPIKTENPLQVALARVLGYRWPAESDTEMELADEARELIEAVKAFDYLSDEDGIFCIPSVNAEQAGAERLRDYLQQVFAGEWNNQTITKLLQKEEAKSTNLEAWLRDEFFVQHCKVFKNRPFVWQIWDGRKDGFSALVNYHKLDKDNLSKLIYTYLNDWIRVCVAKQHAGESGAEGLLSAAQKLKENLEAILQGEAPYDIFVRWKPLEQQPIGWEPDLNDGVRLNIRPFVEAGVLRSKFNVKWGVDRGKNPAGSPWGEVRDNDKHLILEEKREAREN